MRSLNLIHLKSIFTMPTGLEEMQHHRDLNYNIELKENAISIWFDMF